MATTGKVVVVVTPQIGKHEESGYTIARFGELGLWAHGKDQSAALESLKAHFRTYIEVLRDTGELTERLNAAGVTWHPVSEAEEQGIEYEDLSPTASPEPASPEVLASHNTPSPSVGVAWDYGLAHAA